MIKLKKIIIGLISVSFAVFCASYFISMRLLAVRKENLSIKKHEFSGKSIKILHISDVHSKDKDNKLFIWDKIKKLSFDIVVITGDFIADKHTEILPHLPFFRELTKNTPVFYVFGNHEICEEAEVGEAFKSAGVIVLKDENIYLNISGVRLNIIGISDYYSIKQNDLENIFDILKNIDPNEFNIMLSHQPQIFKNILSYDVDLILAGHTHGGQVRFPLLPALYAPGQGVLPKYGDGWYHENGSNLYISKGIGSTVFPIRLFNRPEITIVEVKF
ncbi:MAG: metallophosphoesterase [Defluviitaleaceae bacterium]|nr:metallophosphoesterase [Defluviitaleaceae bacterium]